MELSGSRVLIFALLAGAAFLVGPAAAAEKVFETGTDAQTVQRLRQTVSYLMSLSEEDMLSIVPVQSGICFTACPNCDMSTQDRGNFAWSPERPAEIACRDCGAKYPGNPKYPDDKALEVAGPKGPQKYPYYERPGDNYRIFFRAHADYLARGHMARQCRALAELYWATRDEAFARRGALILVRFAEVYPGYAYHYDNPFQQKVFAPWTQNRIERVPPYRTARWDWWAYMDLSLDLVRAYDCLRQWPGLAQMAEGRSIEMIEKDLIGAMADFVLGFEENYSNMSPFMWRDVVYAARVVGRPQWLHEAVRRLQRFTGERFLYDGHWMETSPSYCAQVFDNLRGVTDALGGYEDPEGYADQVDGRRFDRSVIAKIQAVRADMQHALEAPRFPNGRLLPVNDTWSTGTRSPRSRTEPVLVPGLGVAVLGGGEGEHQLHAYLNFTSGSGHKHNDALSFGLFAFGKELLPDVGYSHTRYRAWTLCTMSHNTVVVNGRESRLDSRHAGNLLRAFVTDGRGFHLAEAESLTAYPDVVTRYRRTLIAVGEDSRDGYLLDVFQVSGGDQHDYLLHGSADDDSSVVMSGAEMTPYDGTLMNPGVVFVPPKGESDRGAPEAAYGFVHGLAQGRAGDVVTLEMRLKESPEIGTRTLLFPGEQTTIFLSQAPSVRRARRADAELDKHQAPFFCARRQGKGLTSVFAAVHEPLNGQPKILTASVIRSDDALVFVVDRGPLGEDYVAVALDGPPGVSHGQFSLDGRYGLVRLRNGRVSEAHLVGGTRLSYGDFGLSGTAGWSGSIRAAVRERSADSRGAFDVSERVAANAAPCTLLLHHPDGTAHGYNVVRIEPTTDGARLFVREDPGFEITPEGETRFVCYPQRTVPGSKNTYEILNAVHMAPER